MTVPREACVTPTRISRTCPHGKGVQASVRAAHTSTHVFGGACWYLSL